MEKIKKIIALLICAITVISLFNGISLVSAANPPAEGDDDYRAVTQVQTYSAGDASLNFTVENGQMTYTRTHNSVSSAIGYTTEAYLISDRPIDTNKTNVTEGWAGGNSFNKLNGKNPYVDSYTGAKFGYIQQPGGTTTNNTDYKYGLSITVVEDILTAIIPDFENSISPVTFYITHVYSIRPAYGQSSAPTTNGTAKEHNLALNGSGSTPLYKTISEFLALESWSSATYTNVHNTCNIQISYMRSNATNERTLYYDGVNTTSTTFGSAPIICSTVAQSVSQSTGNITSRSLADSNGYFTANGNLYQEMSPNNSHPAKLVRILNSVLSGNPTYNTASASGKDFTSLLTSTPASGAYTFNITPLSWDTREVMVYRPARRAWAFRVAYYIPGLNKAMDASAWTYRTSSSDLSSLTSIGYDSSYTYTDGSKEYVVNTSGTLLYGSSNSNTTSVQSAFNAASNSCAFSSYSSINTSDNYTTIFIPLKETATSTTLNIVYYDTSTSSVIGTASQTVPVNRDISITLDASKIGNRIITNAQTVWSDSSQNIASKKSSFDNALSKGQTYSTTFTSSMVTICNIKARACNALWVMCEPKPVETTTLYIVYYNKSTNTIISSGNTQSVGVGSTATVYYNSSILGSLKVTKTNVVWSDANKNVSNSITSYNNAINKGQTCPSSFTSTSVTVPNMPKHTCTALWIECESNALPEDEGATCAVIVTYLDSTTGEIYNSYTDNVTKTKEYNGINTHMPPAKQIDTSGTYQMKAVWSSTKTASEMGGYNDASSYTSLAIGSDKKITLTSKMKGVRVYVPIKDYQASYMNVFIRYTYTSYVGGVERFQILSYRSGGNYYVGQEYRNKEGLPRDGIWINNQYYAIVSGTMVFFADGNCNGKSDTELLNICASGDITMAYFESNGDLVVPAMYPTKRGTCIIDFSVYPTDPPISCKVNYVDGTSGALIKSDTFEIWNSAHPMTILQDKYGNMAPANCVRIGNIFKSEIEGSDGKYYKPVFMDGYTATRHSCNGGSTTMVFSQYDTYYKNATMFCGTCGTVTGFYSQSTDPYFPYSDVYNYGHGSNVTYYTYKYNATCAKGVSISVGTSSYSIQSVMSAGASPASYFNASPTNYWYDPNSNTFYYPTGNNTNPNQYPYAYNITVPCIDAGPQEMETQIQYVVTDGTNIIETIKTVDSYTVNLKENYSFAASKYINQNGVDYAISNNSAVLAYDTATYQTAKNDTSGTNGQICTADTTYVFKGTKVKAKDTAILYIEVARVEPVDGETIPDISPDVIKKSLDPGIGPGLDDGGGNIGYIKPENRAYNITDAIPGTEKIYAEAIAKDYLFDARISNVTGTNSYNITVVMPYILHYKDADGKDLMQSGSITRTIPVIRGYSYWTIQTLSYYKLNKATVKNSSVNEELTVSWTPTIPALEREVYGDVANHVKQGVFPASGTVTLPTVHEYSSTQTPPAAPVVGDVVMENEAEQAVGALVVRNDKLTFAGRILLDGEWDSGSESNIAAAPDLEQYVEAPKSAARSATAQIPGTRANATYVSDTNSFVYYDEVNGLNVNSAYGNTYSKEITFVNDVKVYTPAHMHIISAKNTNANAADYLQNPGISASGLYVILDDNGSLNSLNVKISNKCDNASYFPQAGYGARDYSGYVKQNRFKIIPYNVIPTTATFEVNGVAGYRFNTYYTAPSTDFTLTFPEGTQEGKYRIMILAEALNNTGDPLDGEFENGNKFANIKKNDNIPENASNRYTYAYDNIDFDVTGRMYGLTLYNISGSSEWDNVFKKNDVLKSTLGIALWNLKKPTEYKDSYSYIFPNGTNDRNGTLVRDKAFALPVLSGNNPLLKNSDGLKAGYTWSMYLDTIGSRLNNRTSYIEIVPTFYWVDKNHANRTKVDVYYDDLSGKTPKRYLQVGGTEDSALVKIDRLGSTKLQVAESLYRSTPFKTAAYNLDTPMYTYGLIRSNGKLGYYATNADYPNYTVISRKNAGTVSTEQRYYFEYSLPYNLHVIPQSINGTSSKAFIDNLKSTGQSIYTNGNFKTDGYLIVHFDIAMYDNGMKQCTYDKMWNVEGKKESWLQYGDVFVVYVNKTAADDYEVDHLN